MATACGGTVSGGEPTAGEQLQANGTERCKAACETVVACGVASQSCACVGCACQAGAASCACPPCECSSVPSTPAKCESDCGDAVRALLKDKPQCDRQMLVLLDCLATAKCQAGAQPCQTEQNAMKSCGQSASPTESKPTAGGTPADPGGLVTCLMGFGSVSASGQGAPAPGPGDLVCDNGWDSCSDGRSYGVRCFRTTGSDLACSCIVDGTVESSFTGTGCADAQSAANPSCGWHLG